MPDTPAQMEARRQGYFRLREQAPDDRYAAVEWLLVPEELEHGEPRTTDRVDFEIATIGARSERDDVWWRPVL